MYVMHLYFTWIDMEQPSNQSWNNSLSYNLQIKTLRQSSEIKVWH